jgi:iron complex transport system substrate-binding protein
VFKKSLLIAAVLALFVASCASDTVSEQTTTSSTNAASNYPITIEADNGPVTIETRPERIVSISPTSTEVLFAIGAGDRVVAVDDQSNYPSNAPMTDLTAFQPNVEAIAAYEPDLVFLSYDPGDVIAGLEAIGIPVILHGTAFSLDAAFAQWEQTGAATDLLAEATALVADTATRLESASSSVGDATGLTYYYELDSSYYTATSSSFIGQVIAPTGLVNIADEAPDPDGFGYPQLTTEYIVGTDPSIIILADTICCGQNASTIAARPGWVAMSAVSHGGVVEIDDDIASRWGPRIAELLEAVVEAVVAVQAVDA